jgi:hypothetical protein
MRRNKVYGITRLTTHVHGDYNGDKTQDYKTTTTDMVHYVHRRLIPPGGLIKNNTTASIQDRLSPIGSILFIVVLNLNGIFGVDLSHRLCKCYNSCFSVLTAHRRVVDGDV